GGFATWILKELLEQKYVDYVINVKATQHPEKLFSYSISKSVEEIIKGSKTKYYPVELSEVLKIVKEVPGKYAIIGLPSFIMELRLLSEIDETIKERITFMIGLVCGHQKSSKFADILAWQCGIKPGELKSIDFRKK
ncbi:TPA: coenzyme F420 hydrogenase/dehydrogenase beta subunit N-terminal domain-containing protein, partial [Enterococcus faecium]